MNNLLRLLFVLFFLACPRTTVFAETDVGFDRPAVSIDLKAGRLTASDRRLPGEFEYQQGVLLAFDSEDTAVQKAQARIMKAICHNVPVILLVDRPESERKARHMMQFRGVPLRQIRFLRVPFDTVWARDYGPTAVLGGDRGHAFIDSEYERELRPNDDDVPKYVAASMGMRSVPAPLYLEGGNLIGNGAGLIATTYRVFADNEGRGYNESRITQILRRAFGAANVVYLEPMEGEETGHVDMFATFPGPNVVIVGQYTPKDDPVNAQILNRNAARLAGLATPAGPLSVVRIPMPRPDFDGWRTFTNVLYANGVLVVPVYPGCDSTIRARAIETYRQLLPGWNIVTVDCNDLIGLGGAVHCVTMNLSYIARLPDATTPVGDWDRPLKIMARDRTTRPSIYDPRGKVRRASQRMFRTPRSTVAE